MKWLCTVRGLISNHHKPTWIINRCCAIFKGDKNTLTELVFPFGKRKGGKGMGKVMGKGEVECGGGDW